MLNWRKFFSLFFFPLFVGFGIRDPGWKKIRIRDKHSGSAKLLTVYGTGLQDTRKGRLGTMARKVPNYHRPPLQDKWLQKEYTSEEAHAFCCHFIGLRSLLPCQTGNTERRSTGCDSWGAGDK